MKFILYIKTLKYIIHPNHNFLSRCLIKKDTFKQHKSPLIAAKGILNPQRFLLELEPAKFDHLGVLALTYNPYLDFCSFLNEDPDCGFESNFLTETETLRKLNFSLSQKDFNTLEIYYECDMNSGPDSDRSLISLAISKLSF